jgi:hypothetical protein
VGGSPLSVALGDLNGDGRLDVVTANNASGSASVLLNTTAPGATVASFGPETQGSMGGDPQSVALGDLNGDGGLDIVSANGTSDNLGVLPRVLAHGALQFSATSASVDEGAGTATIQVSRTGGTDSAVMATVGRSGGTASDPGDATLATTTVVFDNNEAGPKTVQVTLVNDAVADSGETVVLAVSSPAGGAVLGAQTSHTLTITDTDRPVATTSAGGLAYTENQPPAPIDPGLTVSDLDSATLSGATVQFTAGYQGGQDVLACAGCSGVGITPSFDPGTGTLILTGAVAPSAYQAALRSVTYQNTSETPSTVARTVAFQVTDAPSSNVSTASPRAIVVTAVNDLPVAASDTYAMPPGTGTTIAAPGVLVNDVDLDGPALTAVKVTEAAHGTVALRPDGGFTYTPAAGYGGSDTFTYEPNDSQDDGNVVTVSLTVGGPALTIGDARVEEGTAGTKAATFPVTLAPPSAGPVTVQVRTQDDSATAGSDYVALSPTTLTFAAGETTKSVTVTVNGDTAREPDEAFSVVLSNPIGAGLSRDSATGFIVNDDSPNPETRSQQVSVQGTRVPGRLQVTLTAETSICPPGNSLQRIEFGAARNARVEVPGTAPGAPGGPTATPGGPDGTPGDFTLPVNAASVTFFVQRQAPGDFRVDFAIVDTCNASGTPFRTFVGGGVGVP